MSGFSELGFSDGVCSGLSLLGMRVPTGIQAVAAAPLLEPVDLHAKKGRGTGSARVDGVVIASETGSGKTAAFLGPLVERLKRDEEVLGVETRKARPRALVLVPTRELGAQVGGVAKMLSHGAKVRTVALVGGSVQKPQRQRLERGLDLVVTTPSRALKLRDDDGVLFLGDVRYVVIDEADAMLGIHHGFRDEVEALLGPMQRYGSLCRVILAGATVVKASNPQAPGQGLRKIAYGRDDGSADTMRWLKHFVGQRKGQVKVVQTAGLGVLPDGIKIDMVVAQEKHSKQPALASVLSSHTTRLEEEFNKRAHDEQLGEHHDEHLDEEPEEEPKQQLGKKQLGKQQLGKQQLETRTLVFCNSISSCRSTAHFIEDHEAHDDRFSVFCMHGEMPTRIRDTHWKGFMGEAPAFALAASAQHKVLICTDIAARGLDFDCAIDHVIMFDLPSSISDFIHRIGRTARGLGGKGLVSLVAKDTHRERRLVNDLLDAIPRKNKGFMELKRDARRQQRPEFPRSPEARPPQHLRAGYKRSSKYQRRKPY